MNVIPDPRALRAEVPATRLSAPVMPWLSGDATPQHEARVLTEGGSLARILLDGQVYTLRITRAGKLILTK